MTPSPTEQLATLLTQADIKLQHYAAYSLSATKKPSFVFANDIGMWTNETAWCKIGLDAHGFMYRESGVAKVQRPTARASYFQPDPLLINKQADEVAYRVYKDLEDESSKRFWAGMLLGLWTIGMLISIFWRYHVGCDGIFQGIKAETQLLFVWLPLVALAGIALFLVGAMLFSLMCGHPERIATARFAIRTPLELLYRRAPIFTTLAATVFVFAAFNTVFRYDLRIHEAGRYTRVHDRLHDTWRTYNWEPCPPPDENDSQ